VRNLARVQVDASDLSRSSDDDERNAREARPASARRNVRQDLVVELLVHLQEIAQPRSLGHDELRRRPSPSRSELADWIWHV
jgi:hypothetical protein